MGRLIWLFLFQILYLLQYQVAALSSSSSSSTHHLCRRDQMSALLQFKHMFTIDSFASRCGSTTYPKTASWNESSSSPDCCSWDDITCDGLTGHVIGLDLSCCRLSGTIHPNSSLFRLSHLQSLNLAFNDFNYSRISSGFGRLASLTHLNLSLSRFSGLLPSDISHLSKMVSLDLSCVKRLSTRNLYVVGEGALRLEPHNFKMLLKNLTQLQELILDGVYISSSVLPNSLMNLSSLTTLNLGRTGLQGDLPNNIFFHLPNLQQLYLFDNAELTGAFPKVNWSSGGSSPLRRLDISGCKLSGSIPTSLGNLTQISELYLSSNRFNGQVPSTLSNLKQLIFLCLSFNNLQGQIPIVFAELVKLEFLGLSHNSFNGQFPRWVANLTQLHFLGLSSIGLTGPLPSNISGLQNLQGLDLSNNLLNGTIPSWLFTLPSLVDLDLSSNRFTGQIQEFQHKSPAPNPPSISNLVNLTGLFLSSNNLSGVVELHIFSNLKNLQYLSLSQNSLSVRTDSNTNTTLPNLHSLHLSSCNINEFPNFLRNSNNLQDLDLSNNNIHGQIPKWVRDASFYFLDLSHNYLEGPLPVPPLFISYFFISHNNLTGEIPTSICNSSSIQILDLSHNNLSGVIPQCLGNFHKYLSVLDLRMNSFCGTIPTTFAKGNQLRNLDLNGNKLEGSLPRALANCRRMEVLDLGNNKLNDTFPHWLESLPQLQVLVLQSNRFHGPIHPSRTRVSFPKLHIIDLSHNKFTGFLPARYFQNLKAMRKVDKTKTGLQYMGNNYYRDSVVLVVKGVVFEIVSILTVFTTIDFSNNQFKGEIPYAIGTLHSLRLLNLSHNSLTGYIPSLLKNLTMLESLDLSSNQLSGEIPWQLASLTFLEALNLSWNHLVGPIPRSTQFDTFQNGSYDGNLALCGFPLSKKCGNDEASQQQTPPIFQLEANSDFMNGFTWKAVLMGYGCGMMFGLVVGYLIFLTGKPEWYIRVVEVELLQKSNKIGYRRSGRRN